MNADHKLHITSEEGRDHWECSCGRAGSCREGEGDLAAEKHISPGESIAYTNKPL